MQVSMCSMRTTVGSRLHAIGDSQNREDGLHAPQTNPLLLHVRRSRTRVRTDRETPALLVLVNAAATKTCRLWTHSPLQTETSITRSSTAAPTADHQPILL